MNRLNSLSDKSFVRVAVRVFQAIDNLMTSYGESSTNPYGRGGALSFGWDMPTMYAIFPRKGMQWQKMLAEAKRRGIKSFPYKVRRRGRGKIVYSIPKNFTIKYAA